MHILVKVDRKIFIKILIIHHIINFQPGAEIWSLGRGGANWIMGGGECRPTEMQLEKTLANINVHIYL